MSKFVTVSYFKNYNSTTLYSNGSIDQPFRITLNIDSIMSISRNPCAITVSDSQEQLYRGHGATKNVYLLETNIGIGHGINDIEFQTYFLTEESYIQLISFLDPISTWSWQSLKMIAIPLRFLFHSYSPTFRRN